MVHTLIPSAGRLSQAIGWSLLHSLWQGALIYFLLLLLFRTFTNMHSRVRHLCSIMGLLLLMAWTVNTALTQWQQLQTVAVHVLDGQAATGGYTIQVSPPSPSYSNIIAKVLPHLASSMPWIIAVYVLGVICMVLRLGRGLLQLNAMRRKDVFLPDESLMRLLYRLQLQLGMVQTVTVRLSARVVVPMVVGVVRPMILLPVTIADDLGPDGMEAILIHELAHISRADFLINFLQSLIETLLFFNPFAWRLSAAIRREREHCCDDLVVAHTSQPVSYARALVSLAARQQHVPSLALGATSHQPILFNRIKRIIEMKRHPLRQGQFVAACCLAALFVVIAIACFTPSFAQNSKKKNKKHYSTGVTQAGSTGNVIVVDSDGVSHVYKSADDLPPHTRAVLDKGLRSLEQHRKELDGLDEKIEQAMNRVKIPNVPDVPEVPGIPMPPPVPEAPEIPDVDSIVDVAMQAVNEAMGKVDWEAMQAQLDTMRINVPMIDLRRLNRNLNKNLSRDINYRVARARYVNLDPHMAEQIRTQVAVARKEASRAMASAQRAREDGLRYSEDARRSADETRREMERARRRMERAREEMEQAREELRRLAK